MGILSQKSRVGEIELFRFIFCLIIVCRHAESLFGENLIFAGGAFGVEFFFLVSGFLMMASVGKKLGTPANNLGKETIGFVLRKMKAVYPEIFISFAFGFAFQYYAKQLSLHDAAKLLMQSFFELGLVQRVGIGSNSVNGVVWYVQSMLLCMTILYPLIRKFPEMTKWVIMPLTALLLMGYLIQNYNHFRTPDKWLGYTYKGNVRAMAELCFGATLYPIVQRLKKLNLRTFAKVLLSCVKWTCWSLVIAYMWMVKTKFKQDAFMLVLLGVAVTLAFSGQCLDVKLYQNKLVLFLGKFSLPLYLNHVYYSHYLNKFLPSGLRFRYQFLIYVICSVLTALVVMALANCIRKLLPNVKKNLKTLLLYD